MFRTDGARVANWVGGSDAASGGSSSNTSGIAMCTVTLAGEEPFAKFSLCSSESSPSLGCLDDGSALSSFVVASAEAASDDVSMAVVPASESGASAAGAMQ